MPEYQLKEINKFSIQIYGQVNGFAQKDRYSNFYWYTFTFFINKHTLITITNMDAKQTNKTITNITQLKEYIDKEIKKEYDKYK